jgi:uncharacterized repeat protein (TIGR03803 family)
LNPRRYLRRGIVYSAIVAVSLLSSVARANDGPTQTVIYSFDGFQPGANPMAGLIADQTGALYGTAANGGNYLACEQGGACGVVFQLTPPAQQGGAWSETVLYEFQNQDPSPPTSNLVFDQAGNLYGTTDGLDDAEGNPVLFQLTQSNGTWTLNSVYGSGTRGQIATPIVDKRGNLYTTVEESFHCCGLVLELSPQPNGTWTQNTLYSFLNNGSDGAGPLGGVIADSSGNLYGTTAFSGSSPYCGTVFELSPQGSGNWKETILHVFTKTDGCNPTAGVVRDAKGNLYGTTEFGGLGPCTSGCGAVFELSPPAQKGGAWTETTLHLFTATDGFYPYAGLAIDSSGALYGTTIEGGNGPCEPTGAGCGTVFRLTPSSSPGGTWTHAYYSFQGPDGTAPYGSVLLDPHHAVLYGTTASGGFYGLGTVFQIVP